MTVTVGFESLGLWVLEWYAYFLSVMEPLLIWFKIHSTGSGFVFQCVVFIQSYNGLNSFCDIDGLENYQYKPLGCSEEKDFRK